MLVLCGSIAIVGSTCCRSGLASPTIGTFVPTTVAGKGLAKRTRLAEETVLPACEEKGGAATGKKMTIDKTNRVMHFSRVVLRGGSTPQKLDGSLITFS